LPAHAGDRPAARPRPPLMPPCSSHHVHHRQRPAPRPSPHCAKLTGASRAVASPGRRLAKLPELARVELAGEISPLRTASCRL
jgi:hypothetical protein